MTKQYHWIIIWGLLGLFCCGCQKQSTDDKPKGKVHSISSLVLTEYQLASKIEVQGLTSPYKSSDLSFRISGVVDKIPVSLGQEVKAEQLLAQLEKTDFSLQWQRAQESLQLAKKKLAKIKADARPEELAIARAKVQSAQKNYQNKLKSYQSQISLGKSNIVSEIDIDRLKTAAEVAEEQVRIAQEELQLLEKGAQAEDIQLAMQEVALAQVEAKIQKQNLLYTELKAPYPGVITELNLEQGEFFNIQGASFQTAIVLDDLYQIKLKVAISQSDIAKIQQGQKVAVKVESLPGKTFPGKVSHVPYKADPVSKTFLTEITIANPNLTIKSGVFATAEITTGEPSSTVLLPPQLLLEDHQGTYVYKVAQPKTQSETEVKRQNVRTGILVGNQIEILSGLSPGDCIVAEGNHYIQNNSRVFVVEQREQR